SLGSENLRNAFAAVDIPFSANVKSRFTVGVRKQDGYVTRISDGTDLGDVNTYTATGKIAFRPFDRFHGTVSFDYTRNKENGSPLVFSAITESATFVRVASSDAGCPGFTFASGLPVPQIQDDRCGNDLQKRGPFKTNGTFPLLSTLKNQGFAVNLAYELND